jgi:hypothetical protein
MKEFIFWTDHKSLTNLNEQRLHTNWQHKALTKLMGLQYSIVYKKGVRMARQKHFLDSNMIKCTCVLFQLSSQCGYMTLSSLISLTRKHRSCCRKHLLIHSLVLSFWSKAFLEFMGKSGLVMIWYCITKYFWHSMQALLVAIQDFLSLTIGFDPCSIGLA